MLGCWRDVTSTGSRHDRNFVLTSCSGEKLYIYHRLWPVPLQQVAVNYVAERFCPGLLLRSMQCGLYIQTGAAALNRISQLQCFNKTGPGVVACNASGCGGMAGIGNIKYIC